MLDLKKSPSVSETLDWARTLLLLNIETIDETRLPEGNVTVAVEYSTVNYKDGLCLHGLGGLVRDFPHVPGIDFAGTVEESSDDRFKIDDKVVLTGWRVGEATNWPVSYHPPRSA